VKKLFEIIDWGNVAARYEAATVEGLLRIRGGV
jgi:hypothetical protein